MVPSSTNSNLPGHCTGGFNDGLSQGMIINYMWMKNIKIRINIFIFILCKSKSKIDDDHFMSWIASSLDSFQRSSMAVKTVKTIPWVKTRHKRYFIPLCKKRLCISWKLFYNFAIFAFIRKFLGFLQLLSTVDAVSDMRGNTSAIRLFVTTLCDMRVWLIN